MNYVGPFFFHIAFVRQKAKKLKTIRKEASVEERERERDGRNNGSSNNNNAIRINLYIHFGMNASIDNGDIYEWIKDGGGKTENERKKKKKIG